MCSSHTASSRRNVWFGFWSEVCLRVCVCSALTQQWLKRAVFQLRTLYPCSPSLTVLFLHCPLLSLVSHLFILSSALEEKRRGPPPPLTCFLCLLSYNQYGLSYHLDGPFLTHNVCFISETTPLAPFFFLSYSSQALSLFLFQFPSWLFKSCLPFDVPMRGN